MTPDEIHGALAEADAAQLEVVLVSREGNQIRATVFVLRSEHVSIIQTGDDRPSGPMPFSIIDRVRLLERAPSLTLQRLALARRKARVTSS